MTKEEKAIIVAALECQADALNELTHNPERGRYLGAIARSKYYEAKLILEDIPTTDPEDIDPEW